MCSAGAIFYLCVYTMLNKDLSLFHNITLLTPNSFNKSSSFSPRYTTIHRLATSPHFNCVVLYEKRVVMVSGYSIQMSIIYKSAFQK